MTTPNAAPLDLDSFAGFTPGPWHTSRIGTATYIKQKSGYVIAQVSDSLAYDPKHASNAALIAAAPALLAECKRLRAENERLREALQLAEATICRLKPPVPYDSTQGTRDVIRAALEPQS